MSDNQSSAEEFDPVSFAEHWLLTEWPIKRPHEYRRYVEAMKRTEED